MSSTYRAVWRNSSPNTGLAVVLELPVKLKIKKWLHWRGRAMPNSTSLNRWSTLTLKLWYNNVFSQVYK
jgi:hypothetical protein